MCGIIGILLANEEKHVNQELFDGLTVLQHRGQDAAGMVTVEDGRLRLRKDNGLVRDVFQQSHMEELRGNIGIGHVRYPTAGSSSNEEAQPFITNYPFGIGVAHNGNLTNTDELQSSLKHSQFRHVNTDSDSEVLLNVFAESLTNELKSKTSQDFTMHDVIFDSMETVMNTCKGGYAGVYMINGFGLVGFRDPNGIRPLVFGVRKSGAEPFVSPDKQGDLPDSPSSIKAEDNIDFCIASESVVVDTLGFRLVRYVILKT
jgi:amidophosphoribosyltransferase